MIEFDVILDQPHDCEDIPGRLGRREPRIQEKIGSDGRDQPEAGSSRGDPRHSPCEEPEKDSAYCGLSFRDHRGLSHAPDRIRIGRLR